MYGIHAQTIKQSNVPPLIFEVIGSIYPWDIHDEGINLILDNMTGITGINLVSMLVLMHWEHAPFKTIKDTKAKVAGCFNLRNYFCVIF